MILAFSVHSRHEAILPPSSYVRRPIFLCVSPVDTIDASFGVDNSFLLPQLFSLQASDAESS